MRMTKEDITVYTRRITQGNKSDIIVVLYDIYFSYEEDAKAALEIGDVQGLTAAIRHMNDVAEHLKRDLDFTYKIAGQLYPLYDYVQRCLSKALYKKDDGQLALAARVMSELREAFIEVARQDDSGRQMQNAETVTAGYTYGRGSLSEITDGTNRGFFA